MTRIDYEEKRPSSRTWVLAERALTLVVIVILMSGCSLGKRRPSRVAEQYTLEYASPRIESCRRIPEPVLVERFSVVQLFNSPEMVYSSGPFKRDVYLYHRWRSNPGDMVTDYLIRDLRHGGCFLAVFSYREAGDARFVLRGVVEELLEADGREGQDAVLTLNVTFLDMRQMETTKRIIFQKTYRSVEPMSERTPGGLAMGMSRAMEQLSRQVIADLHEGAHALIE